MFICEKKHEKGFTLVELAIVLIIIGLLIGGTLKGQELINGARATATVSQIRAMEAGALTFLDTYKGFPGDLISANTRLPDCAGDCFPVTGANTNARGGVQQTVGNGVIDFAPGNRMAPGQENVAFFMQMFSADLMDGIDGVTPIAAPFIALGKNVLPTKLGSGSYWRVGYINRPIEMPNTASGGTVGRTGHYLALAGQSMPYTTDPFGAAELSADDLALGVGPTRSQNVRDAIRSKGIPTTSAQRVDSKYDDGNPNTGNVVAANTAAPLVGTCALNAANNNDYNTQNRQNDCAIYIRFAP